MRKLKSILYLLKTSNGNKLESSMLTCVAFIIIFDVIEIYSSLKVKAKLIFTNEIVNKFKNPLKLPLDVVGLLYMGGGRGYIPRNYIHIK